ncbi:unnamed protein product [Soboliphyme baturini]|uniref:Methyltranfer_dom domain-containing protein n=1 Tax=Soboliphyme baturini TaxID=241478 RepID=A0A183IPF3_9BILA|nr:unnamed protein product [Soboliphyme baturini]
MGSATAVEPECQCKDNATGATYNFCYHLPVDPSVRGKRFDCRYLPQLKRLRLIGNLNNDYVWIEAGGIPEPTFITAASDNHFLEVQRLIVDFQRVLPNKSVVFYDIGLSEDNAAEMKSFCNVKYKKFHFSNYPVYVRKLKEYRWKILLIAVSSNIRFHESEPKCHALSLEHLKHLAEGRPPVWRNIKYLKDDHLDKVEEEAVLCALENKCLVPDGSKLFCKFNDGTYDKRVACHRYDQSLMSLLLTNRHAYNVKLWTSGVEDCFNITPGAITRTSPKICH